MRLKYFVSFGAYMLILYTSFLYPRTSDGKIKLLVLIIDSDSPNDPYEQLRKIWRAYMHLDQEHISAYFIRGNPNLSTLCTIQGDTIWTKSEENWVPGIVQKTILSMEHMLVRNNFDYVLRTCISSFYIFPRVLTFLDKCPKNNFYCSVIGYSHGIRYGGGCGFFLSPDLANMLIEQKSDIWNSKLPDDVAFGKFFMDRHIAMFPHKRMDLSTLSSWIQHKNNIPANIFQFRAKNSVGRRFTDEISIDLELLKMFYHISI